MCWTTHRTLYCMNVLLYDNRFSCNCASSEQYTVCTKQQLPMILGYICMYCAHYTKWLLIYWSKMCLTWSTPDARDIIVSAHTKIKKKTASGQQTTLSSWIRTTALCISSKYLRIYKVKRCRSSYTWCCTYTHTVEFLDHCANMRNSVASLCPPAGSSCVVTSCKFIEIQQMWPSQQKSLTCTSWRQSVRWRDPLIDQM